jgi:hypothetical protein
MRNAQPAAWPPPSAQADPTLASSPVRAFRRPPSVGRRVKNLFDRGGNRERSCWVREERVKSAHLRPQLPLGAL